MRTWMLEQAVLAALLGAAISERPDGLTAAAVAWAVAIVAAQKVRSGANRQVEQNELAGVAPAPLRCARMIRRWAAVAQLAPAVAAALAAPGPAHVAVAAYATLYPVWRRFYRSRRPATLDA